MKKELKEKAEELRKQGISIIKIAKELGVSKSSISTWTKNIVLTEEQQFALSHRPCSDRQAEAHSNTFRIRRQLCQDKGKKKIKENDPLYIAGCMLYWGEGLKSKNTVMLANAEPAMLILFKKFLLTFFSVSDENITVTINCYTDYHSFEEIKTFWLSKLELPESCLKKSQIDNRPISSKNIMGHSEYGTCYLTVCDTSIVQEIYGAIQEFGGFNNSDWLNGKIKKLREPLIKEY